MRIILFLLGSLIWFGLVYVLTALLVSSFKTGMASAPMKRYSRHRQPAMFWLTVGVQMLFWLGLVGWWLNGAWNLVAKLLD